MIYPKSRFDIAKGYRLQFEEQQGTHVLLYPEGMVELSETAYEVLSLVQEDRTYHEMIETLSSRYDDERIADDVRGFLEEAHAMGWIDIR